MSAVKILPRLSLAMSSVYSFGISFLFFLAGIWSQNWMLYNFLSICCCVGMIKMFKFKSLKNATYSMAIIVITMIILLIWAEIKLDRSYNDYTSDVSSPLFIEVPDLVDNLYRKCSWLFIFDVILPGAILTFLRDYDENYHEGWGGVYTYLSIGAYIISIIIWIIIEGITYRDVPFCLFGYPFLLATIIALAHSRN